MNFQHMNADEIYNYLRDFGTDDQKIIADKLYEAELDWSNCPYCESSNEVAESADLQLSKLEDRIEDAIKVLEGE